MSVISSRQVVVDDNDSSIVYSSTWASLTNESKNIVGNFGATLKSTLHGTNTNGSFRYDFSGTRIGVYGTNNVTNSSGIIDPSWECFIDGTSIGATVPFAYPENNWLLCSADNLTNTHHTLTVNALSKGRDFYFDYLQYIPSNPSDLSSSLVLVPRRDPDIVYDSNWQDLGSVASVTRVNNSSATVRFTGVSVTWYTITPSELPISPSRGTFSIDGGPSQPFVLPGLNPQEVTQYNQVLFQSSGLTNSPHSLTVTYLGDQTSTPLTLSHLLVQNASHILSSSSGGAAGGSTASNPHNNSDGLAAPSNSVNGPKIAAGILGGALFVCLVAFISVKYRKYRRDGGKFQIKGWENIPKPSKPSFTKISFSRKPPRPIESGSMSTLGLFGPEDSHRRRREMATYSSLSPLRRLEADPEQPPMPSLTPPSLPPPTPPPKPRTPPVQLQAEQPEASGSKPRRKHKGKTKEAKAVAIENLGENDLYYGGYQTWGQTKALEAASGARPRDSYC